MRHKVILEIGSNWKSLDDIKHSIDFARSIGALSKLQLWQTDKFVRRFNPNYSTYKRFELPRKWVEEIKAEDVFYSVFDPDSLLWLKTEINPEFYKVASLDSNQKWLIESCGMTNKMTFLSCGVYGLESIRQAVKWYNNSNHLTLMHSINYYGKCDYQMNYLRDRINGSRIIPFGLSLNYPNTLLPALGVALGTVAIEVHFRLDHITKTPDAPHSMTKKQVRQMIENIRIAEDNMGNNDRPLDIEDMAIRVGKRVNGKR